MTSTSSVSGLVSGLDTASIISQLMQVEAGPQTLLKSQLSTQQSSISTLQSLNSKFASLATKAQALNTAVSWSPVKATSSTTDVTVTADGTATPASVSFTVGAVATSTKQTYDTTATLDAKPMAANLDFRVDFPDSASATSSTWINTGDGSLQGIAASINGADTGLHATLVMTGTDQATSKPTYQLSVTSTKTGSTSGFTLTQADKANPTTVPANPVAFLDGNPTTVDGTDALITLTGQAALTSHSNTFTDLMPGVDVTVSQVTAPNAAPTTVTVATDTATASAAAKSLVDAANDILSTIDQLTAYDATTKTAGPLAGDATIRSLRSAVTDAVTNSVDRQSLAPVGIQLDRSGALTFDANAFATAFAANPAKVGALLGGSATWTGTGSASLSSATWKTQAGPHTVDLGTASIDNVAGTLNGSLLSGATGTKAEGLVVNAGSGASGTLTYVPGFAARLEALAQRASDSQVGSLTSDITGRQSSATNMQDAISDWDVRLTAKQTALNAQFSAMEVALGTLQNQASWLSGQISSLPTTTSGA